MQGRYVHADETGWRVAGENWYAWSFSNEKAVLYTIENTRGHGVPDLKWFVKQVWKKHKRCRTAEQRMALHVRMEKALERFWKGIKYKDKDAETIRKWWLEKRHRHPLTFLRYHDVSWENNAAERAIRGIVIKRKICGGSRSQRGAERESINQSCLATLLKQGKSIFTEIPLIFEQAKENYKKVQPVLTS